jgi:hypothetical protein
MLIQKRDGRIIGYLLDLEDSGNIKGSNSAASCARLPAIGNIRCPVTMTRASSARAFSSLPIDIYSFHIAVCGVRNQAGQNLSGLWQFSSSRQNVWIHRPLQNSLHMYSKAPDP